MSRPKSFLYFHDVPLNQASDICGVSVQTVKRWISTGRAPSAAVHLVELYRDRRVIPESWAGKVVIRDSFGLCTQSGYSISFSQLETYGWHLASFWRQERLHQAALAKHGEAGRRLGEPGCATRAPAAEKPTARLA